MNVFCWDAVILKLNTASQLQQSEKLVAELLLLFRCSEEQGHVKGCAFGNHGAELGYEIKLSVLVRLGEVNEMELWIMFCHFELKVIMFSVEFIYKNSACFIIGLTCLQKRGRVYLTHLGLCEITKEGHSGPELV